MTVNSPSGSTLQCGTWLWDDMPLNLRQHPSYWNSTSGFDFDHITAVDMSFCTSLRNFYPNRTTLGRKKWRHVDFQDGRSQPSWILGGYNSGYNSGFFEKPNYITSYWSSVDTIALNCLVFQKIAFLYFGVKIQDGGSPPSWILGVQ